MTRKRPRAHWHRHGQPPLEKHRTRWGDLTGAPTYRSRSLLPSLSHTLSLTLSPTLFIHLSPSVPLPSLSLSLAIALDVYFYIGLPLVCPCVSECQLRRCNELRCCRAGALGHPRFAQTGACANVAVGPANVANQAATQLSRLTPLQLHHLAHATSSDGAPWPSRPCPRRRETASTGASSLWLILSRTRRRTLGWPLCPRSS